MRLFITPYINECFENMVARNWQVVLLVSTALACSVFPFAGESFRGLGNRYFHVLDG